MSEMIRGRRSDQRGFTLLEMLIVIAIIAILMALLIPMLSYARRKSRETATLANIKNIRIALDDYYTEYQGTYPIDGTKGNGQIFDSGAGITPGFYNTHCTAQGAVADKTENNSLLTTVLTTTKHLVVNVSNLDPKGSFMEYFGDSIICRFLILQSVDKGGNVISDKLSVKPIIWSYGADRTNWINATQDYINMGLPNYDGVEPTGGVGGSGEIGKIEAAPLPRDDNLTNWR